MQGRKPMSDFRVRSTAHESKRPTFLLLMEDYQGSYTNALLTNPQNSSLPYKACVEQINSTHIYYGDAYIHALASQGYGAHQVVPMCWPLQHKWAAEHHVRVPPSWFASPPFRWLWLLTSKYNVRDWTLHRIVSEQIKRFRPRFLWVFSGVPVSSDSLAEWSSYTERTILWWSCPLDPEFPYDCFDLILSGIPALVRYFRIQGIRCCYLPHAFDPRILQQVSPASDRVQRVAFVGSLSPAHIERISFLDSLSRRVEIDFYGQGVDMLPEGSPLRSTYRGPAWGNDLYSVYGSYLIAFHKNIDVAGRSASAKRLFEATGMGACVVAEASTNMADFFEPGEEIVTYSSLEECVDRIRYLVENPQEAVQMGEKAQRRTLKEHCYENRVQQLVNNMTDLGFL